MNIMIPHRKSPPHDFDQVLLAVIDFPHQDKLVESLISPKTCWLSNRELRT